MKKILSAFLAFALVLCACLAACGAEKIAPDGAAFETRIAGVNEHGSLILTASPQQLKDAGIAADDIVRVTVGQSRWINVPCVQRYTEVASGLPMLIERKGVMLLAVSYGAFAADARLYHEENGAWKLNDGVRLADVPVTVALDKKGAYASIRRMRLYATDSRKDYASDEMFANFRAVKGGRLGANALYRSSIPSSVTRPRAPYADRLAEHAGVRTFLNLANSPETLAKNMNSPAGQSRYYRKVWKDGGVIALALPAVFDRPSFRAGLAKELKFMISRPGPYLVHCAEGKDRAGFVSFLLAALMGASREELERDYGQSYVNFYHLTVGEPRYTRNVGAAMRHFMHIIDAAESAQSAEAEAKNFIRGLGLTDAEIDKLQKCLAAEWPVS